MKYYETWAAVRQMSVLLVFGSFMYKLDAWLPGSSPSRRWIVNFDYDFMDGLVLAAVVGAHAPFVVRISLTWSREIVACLVISSCSNALWKLIDRGRQKSKS